MTEFNNLTPVTGLSSFNADLVTSYFYTTAEKPHEYAALRFMFKMMLEELPPNTPRTEAGRIAADLTIEKISFQYSLNDHFSSDFFKTLPSYREDALTVAAICDRYIGEASPQAGFDADILGQAQRIWAEASSLMAETAAFNPANNQYSKEGIFLAHLHALDNLVHLEQHFDSCSADDLLEIVGTKFQPIYRFVDRQTKLGQELHAFLKDVEEKVDHIVNPQRRGAHLSLVHSIQPGQSGP
ncbi:MAG: hypothetical protein WC989_00020 [Micavibrio sp.]